MPDDLVFSPFIGSNPESMYQKLTQEFRNLLEVVGLNGRKENSLRGIVTFHSFRRFVKSIISDSVNQDYSEWFSEIVGYAEKENVELIVMGTKGRGKMKKTLLGSTASGVVMNASCTVMVVR